MIPNTSVLMKNELSAGVEPVGAIIALDVDYRPDEASVSGILFSAWDADQFQVITQRISEYCDYEAGAFYKRELPCLLFLLNAIDTPIRCIVIDGYVHLGEESHAGLGEYLYRALDSRIPVIGVAKSYFNGTPAGCELYRGASKKPLYITAAGVELKTAKEMILKMHGDHRLPLALKLADQICRKTIFEQ